MSFIKSQDTQSAILPLNYSQALEKFKKKSFYFTSTMKAHYRIIAFTPRVFLCCLTIWQNSSHTCSLIGLEFRCSAKKQALLLLFPVFNPQRWEWQVCSLLALPHPSQVFTHTVLSETADMRQAGVFRKTQTKALGELKRLETQTTKGNATSSQHFLGSGQFCKQLIART